MTVDQGVFCGGCGTYLNESPSLPVANRQPCPSCGSRGRKHLVQITEIVRARVSFSMKHKRPGVRKPLTEVFTGSQLRKSRGDYVEKERLIDRQNDRYKEKVVTEAGEVLRDVDEPLSQHQGYGTAKFNER